MQIDRQTTISRLLTAYPYLLEWLPTVNEHYSLLQNPLMRKTVGRFATLAKVADIGGIDVVELIRRIDEEIARHDREQPTVQQTPESLSEIDTTKKIQLKEIIKDLHSGKPVDEVRNRFNDLVKDISPYEISKLEQSLIEEGLPHEEIHKMCDLHVEVFKKALTHNELPGVNPGHPVHTFMLENRACEKRLVEIHRLLENVQSENEQTIVRSTIEALNDINAIDRHYLRKENHLFPLLEEKGFSGPSKVMWAIHDDIRRELKQAREFADRGNAVSLRQSLPRTLKAIAEMIFKEEHILFPTAMELLSSEDWQRVADDETAIGYAFITPDLPKPTDRTILDGAVSPGSTDKTITLSVGHLDREMIDLLLTSLPFEITMIDAQDRVVYYSATKDRLFPRTPAVIGRKVQNCHPPKSLDIVQRIIDEFRTGTKTSADFRVHFKGKYLYIRYLALTDAEGQYRGTLEVTQDISTIVGLTGEQRLLDWN